jgi:hypothetical protein
MRCLWIGINRNATVEGAIAKVNVMWNKRGTCVAVNATLLALLFLSVSFNKEYLRPAFAGNPVLDLFTGSYPNFIAAYVISLFPVCPMLTKRPNITRGMQIVLATAAGVFIILTIEELAPVFGVSKVRDGSDIIASALGSSCAILTFHFLRRAVSRRKNEAGLQDVTERLEK